MYSQDPSFSQPYANRLLLNPAFAGDSECPYLAAGYRNHLPGSGSYISYVASWQSYFESLNGGLGLVVMNDRQGQGIFNSFSVSASYSYHVQIRKDVFLNAGLEAGLFHRNRNLAGLVYTDMLDPSLGGSAMQEDISSAGRNAFDISTGLLASYRNFYFGLAIHHLTEPDQSVSSSAPVPLGRKYTVHAGTSIPVGTGRNVRGLISRGQWMFSPTFIFQHQNQSASLSYGLYVSRMGINVGAWLKQELSFDNLSMTLLAGYSGGSFSVAYSYDFGVNVSGLAVPFSGSHELSLGVRLPCVEKRRKIRAVKCPDF